MKKPNKKANKKINSKNTAFGEFINQHFGSQTKASKILGHSQSALSHYSNGLQLPDKLAIEISLKTDLKYMPEDLKPDSDWNWLYDFIKKYNKKRERK